METRRRRDGAAWCSQRVARPQGGSEPLARRGAAELRWSPERGRV